MEINMREIEDHLIHDLSNRLSAMNGQLLKLKKTENENFLEQVLKMEADTQLAQKLLRELRARLSNKSKIQKY